MGEKKNAIKENWTSLIVPVLVAVITTIGYIQIQNLKNDVNNLEHELNVRQVENNILLSQLRFEEDQKARRDQTLSTWIPKLVGLDEEERIAALAVLSSIFPDEVNSILVTVSITLSDTDSVAFLGEAIQETKPEEGDIGEYYVIIATSPNLPSAEQWVRKAEENGYTTSIFSFKQGFGTAIGPFPTMDAATSANIAIRLELNSGAYVMNIIDTCGELVDVEGQDYKICGVSEEN